MMSKSSPISADELARMRADMLNGYAADDKDPRDIRTETCDV